MYIMVSYVLDIGVAIKLVTEFMEVELGSEIEQVEVTVPKQLNT